MRCYYTATQITEIINKMNILSLKQLEFSCIATESANGTTIQENILAISYKVKLRPTI